MRQNRFMQAVTRFFQTIAAWILVGRKEFSKMVREAAAEEDKEKVDDAKKEIAKEDVDKELSVKEKETLANLIGRQEMSMGQAILRICDNRFKEAGIEGFDNKTREKILSGEIPAKEALSQSKDLINEITEESKKGVPVYNQIDRGGLESFLGEDRMNRADNLIARELGEIETETGVITDEDRFFVTTKIFKEELQEKLYDEGFGKETTNKTFNSAVKDALEKGNTPEYAMLTGYCTVKNDLSHIRDELMAKKEYDGLQISGNELRKTFTDEFKGPESKGEEGFNHIIADYMDGKSMPVAMAMEMKKVCDTLGVPADEKIFRDRIVNDMGKKISLEKCVKDAIYDMGKENMLTPFENDQKIKNLLDKDEKEFEDMIKEDPEFEQKSQNMFENIMKGIHEQGIEGQESITTMTLDELGLDLHETQALVTNIQEFDKSTFEKYPDIKPVEKVETVGQLNAFKACLGKKMYQDGQDLKDKNYKALDERGVTKDIRRADKEFHSDLKTLVETMKKHDIKTMSELNQIVKNTETKLEQERILENQRAEAKREIEEDKEESCEELTHEDIIAANAVNDLGFAIMASNAPGMDADDGFRDFDDVLEDLNAPSSALDGIDDMNVDEFVMDEPEAEL